MNPRNGFGAVSVDDFARVANALLSPEDAEDIIRTFRNGWFGYTLDSPLLLGLAAVSPAAAAYLIRLRPELEAEVRRMQDDPDLALIELRRRMDE
jgi:hypothetical protein